MHGAGAPYQPPTPTENGMSTRQKGWLYGCLGCAGAAVLLLLVLAACGAVLSAGEDSADQAPTVSETSESPTSSPTNDDQGAEQSAAPEPAAESQEPEPEPEPEPTDDTISDGVHMVGDDLAPGTYRTDGPGPDNIMGMCYWARLAGTSGELGDIIANDNIQGPGVVTVSGSDVALELSGGCEWELTE